MSFSQSLSLGEQTLFQLDVCEGNIHCNGKSALNNNKPVAAISRNPNKSSSVQSLSANIEHQSPSTRLSNDNKGLDVIDESPTEKVNMLGQSIRERLKNASTSKKSGRKHMRRSRSDPINGANNSNRSNSLGFFEKHGFSEDTDLFLDSTMDWDETKNDRTTYHQKSKISQKLDDRFENDDFDKYFNDIQTPKIQRELEKAMEVDDEEVNVSEVKRLIQTEQFNKTADQVTESKDGHLNDDCFDWEDSAFFNDLLASQQQNTKNVTAPGEVEVTDNPPDEMLADPEYISMQSSQRDAVEEELESCFLEVSMELSKLNATEIKSEIQQMGSQLDTSLCSRSLSERSMVSANKNINRCENGGNYSSTLPKPINNRSIDNLIEWNCSAAIIKAYKKKGILEMFEWQVECLNQPEIKNDVNNLLYSAPTSAGKTFVSEILMFQTVLKRQKKVIVILPFISVVREKMYSLQDLLRSSGIRVEGFFGGHTAPGGFENTDIAICTIERANAIVNRLLEQKSIDTIGMIVVDEVHLISDSNRGYILELLLTKILFSSRILNANIRIVAMSATLPNAQLVQNWLNAEFYQTDFRPIELCEMIKMGTKIYDNSMNSIRELSKEDYAMIQNDPDHIAQLCIETIVNSAAVIIFCPSKDWCEKLALHVAQNIYKLGKSQTPIGEKIRKEIDLPAIEEIKVHLKNSPAGLDSVLKQTISYAVAFHHAGLTYDERDIIESAFCQTKLRVIVATSTLSSGVNLPARRVIIRTPMFANKPMCSLTYKQMIGRAGRMGKDTEGESILICSNQKENTIGQELIRAIMKPITSCLANDSYVHLKRALLEITASGVATKRTELEAFVKCTLFHSEYQFQIKYFDQILEEYNANPTRMKKKPKSTDDTFTNDANDSDFVGNCMRFLENYEFIRLQFDEEIKELKFVSTRLGYACLASSMPPTDGIFLFSELQKARQNFVLETDLHAVYLVTPFSVCYQLQDIDWRHFWDMWDNNLSPAMKRVGHLVGVSDAFLAKASTRSPNTLDNQTLKVHKRFYTSLALYDLINELSLHEAAIKYKLNRGTLQSLQQTASTFAGIVKSFCKALNWDLLELIVSQFQDRIFFGVHQDLVELMKISVLNGKRARALFDAGYQTLVEISKANVLSIEKCLVDSIGFEIQKRDDETNYAAEQRNKQFLLHVTGRAGLSTKEAAQTIIDEARNIVSAEMGIENIVWSQQPNLNENKDDSELIPETISNGNQQPATLEKSVNIPIEQQQKVKKRKIPLDADVVTPTKRPNRGQMNGGEKSSSSDSSSGHSDVDSIDLNNSTPFYNDENDDFMEKLQPSSNDQHHLATQRLHIVDVAQNSNEFNKFLKSFQSVKECGFAISVAHIDPIERMKQYRCSITPECYVYGISMCYQSKHTVHFLSLQDDDGTVDFNKRIEFIQKNIFANSELTLQINDAKTQLNTLLMAIPGISRVNCRISDSQVAQWLIQPEEERSFSKLITLHAPNCIDLSTSISNGRTSLTTTTKIRSAIKACITRQILPAQQQILKEMGKIYAAFKEMEMPIQKSLLHMEQTGMGLDRPKLEALSEDISDYIGELETEIYRLNGKRFAVSSSREVAKVLQIRKKNGTIAAKCTRAQLLQCKKPIAKLILEHRSLHAILLKSIQPLIKKTRENNRIYGTSYSFTQTGRISMHEPNLQNVAKDFQTQFRPRVFSCRSAFAVNSNRMLISADFCQLELRVLAHLSRDQSLISIFSTLNDVFISIAAKWNKVAETDVTDKMRNDTKQICYGIIYGMGIKSLAVAMNRDEEEAQSLHESFHQTYPGIRNYTNEILGLARQNGYVETLAGRRRYIPDLIEACHPRKRAQAERQAINTTIQGSAADIAKYAILRMERNLLKYGKQLQINPNNDPVNGINLVLHLHDELLYEVPNKNVQQVMKILKSSMENCAKLLVPLKVKLKKGQCWGSMSRIELK